MMLQKSASFIPAPGRGVIRGRDNCQKRRSQLDAFLDFIRPFLAKPQILTVLPDGDRLSDAFLEFLDQSLAKCVDPDRLRLGVAQEKVVLVTGNKSHKGSFDIRRIL